MDQKKLTDIHVQIRRIYNLLGEVLDLSQQLASSLDRNDQVAMSMLLGMRNEPIERMQMAKEAIHQQLNDMPANEAEQMRALLNGAPPQNSQEEGLAAQVAANERLLKQVQTLDRQINLKIAHEQSVYS